MSAKETEKIVKKWLKDTSKPLNLSNLGIKGWPKVIKKNSKKIIELDCSNNALTKFDFTLPGCKRLVCSGCSFEKLTRLGKCEYLDCADNSLIDLPTMRKCKVLVCHNNQLEKIDPKKYDNLVRISYFGNPLKKTPIFGEDIEVVKGEEVDDLEESEVDDLSIEESEVDDLSIEESEVDDLSIEESEVDDFSIEDDSDVDDLSIEDDSEVDDLSIDDDSELDDLGVGDIESESGEESDIGLIDEDLLEEEEDENEEEIVIKNGIKIERAYFNIKPPISPSYLKEKRKIMEIPADYRRVEVFRLVPIKKVVREIPQKRLKIELSVDIREIDVGKPRKREKVKPGESTIFEIEKIPPRYGKWPKGKTYYVLSELRILAQENGITVAKQSTSTQLVKSLINVFLDMKKVPLYQKSTGKDDYYTSDQINAFFRGLGIAKKLKYSEKISKLEKMFFNK